MASNRVHVVMHATRQDPGGSPVSIHRSRENAERFAADFMARLGGKWKQDNSPMGGGVWSPAEKLVSQYQYSDECLPHVWIQSCYKSGLTAAELGLLTD